MQFILILFMAFSFSAQAQKSINAQTFQVNVRPVLNGILGDFYQMISLFPDFPKELVGLVQNMEKLTQDKENLLESCPRLLDQKCANIISSLQVDLSQLQAKTLELLARQKMSESIHLNNLSGFKLINDFHVELTEVKGELDNTSLMIKAKVPQRRETYAVIKRLDELSTIISLTVVEYIPFNYRDDFRHFYFNFVHPVQLQISKSRNYEFLNRNINELNFALNLLNMNLTKRNKKTPEGMAPFLSVIHNRWNSLLRYYM